MSANPEGISASSRRRARFALAFAAVASALLLSVFADSVARVGQTFPGFLIWENGVLVALHRSSWTGLRAGLPLQDGVVLEVDGRPFPGGRRYLEEIARLDPGTAVHYRVRSGGAERVVAVPTMRFSTADYAATLGLLVIDALALFATAVIALYLRPDRSDARALAAASASVGAYCLLSVDFLSAYRLLPLFRVFEASSVASLAYFGLVFPTERLRPAARWVVVGALAAGLLAIEAAHASSFHSRPELADRLNLAIYGVLAAVIVGISASFAEALLRAGSPERRMRAAVVFAGGLLTFLVPGIAILAFALLGWSFSWTVLLFLFVFFPVCALYAVVRQDLLGAERFVRLTVGYALATSLVVLGYALMVLVLDRFISPGASASPATAFVLLVGLAVSFDPLRLQVQRGVDRAFFRSRVDSLRVLEATGAELASLATGADIARRVGERLCEALALEWATLSQDEETDPEPSAALVEPVAFASEPLGVLACGAKRSGAPFSSDERDLVKGLATQAALALHNARSIRALEEAQEELLRSARLAAIGEFAGAVVHGIRNPLSGIRASAQVAAEQARDGPIAATLRDVISEADRLDQRIRTLLDFSRPYEPTRRPTDLRELLDAVRSAVGGQARRQGVRVEVDGPGEAVVCDVDPDYLEEALLELAGNALRAMPDGGALTFQLERDGGSASILVADTGPGIAPGVRERVFELFFTTRREGTGLGLATVKKVVERNGGAIRLEDSDGGGARFRILLAGASA